MSHYTESEFTFDVHVHTVAADAHGFLINLGDEVGSYESGAIYPTRPKAWKGAEMFIQRFGDARRVRQLRDRCDLSPPENGAPGQG